MCSTVQTINKFNSNKNWLALVTKTVTKLCFASVRLRMCDCKRPSAHNFVDFCLQTTPTTSEVLRCLSPSRCTPSSLTHQTLRRRDVVQSPFTVVEVDLSVGADHPCCRKPTDLFVASHWLERSSSRFSVTLLVFSRADHSTSQVLTTSYVVFISTFRFYWRLASKSLQANQTSTDWFHHRDVTHCGC